MFCVSLSGGVDCKEGQANHCLSIALGPKWLRNEGCYFVMVVFQVCDIMVYMAKWEEGNLLRCLGEVAWGVIIGIWEGGAKWEEACKRTDGWDEIRKGGNGGRNAWPRTHEHIGTGTRASTYR